MNLQVHFTSNKEDWATPPALFADLHGEFDFTLDPCAAPENAKCERYFTKEQNGLEQSWAGERVFMNPPYGRIVTGLWIAKAYHEAQKGALVVCLIPSRTDTAWWHNFVSKAAEVRFIRGRVKFIGGRHSAPFPSAIVVFRQGGES